MDRFFDCKGTNYLNTIHKNRLFFSTACFFYCYNLKLQILMKRQITTLNYNTTPPHDLMPRADAVRLITEAARTLNPYTPTEWAEGQLAQNHLPLHVWQIDGHYFHAYNEVRAWCHILREFGVVLINCKYYPDTMSKFADRAREAKRRWKNR